MDTREILKLISRHNRINSKYDQMFMDVSSKIIAEDDRIVKILRDSGKWFDVETKMIKAYYRKESQMHRAISENKGYQVSDDPFFGLFGCRSKWCFC